MANVSGAIPASLMLAWIPLGRFGVPQEVADSVLYLAAPASDMMTGQAIFIDGGFTAS